MVRLTESFKNSVLIRKIFIWEKWQKPFFFLPRLQVTADIGSECTKTHLINLFDNKHNSSMAQRKRAGHINRRRVGKNH